MDQKLLEQLYRKHDVNYKKIPAAFLVIKFQQFKYPIMYSDQESFISNTKFHMCKQNQGHLNFAEIFVEKVPFEECIRIIDYDNDENLPDVSEELYEEISRVTGDDKDIVPNVIERKRLKEILIKSNIQTLSQKDKNLVWKFRYSLLKKQNSLAKFLNSVNWKLLENEKEAFSLLQNWTNVQYDEALYLLSYFYSANNIFTRSNISNFQAMEKVREYATTIIEKIDEGKFAMILL